MKRIFIIFSVVILIISIFTFSASAVSFSTYGDVAATSSQTTNLISFAINYDSFSDADYIIFNDVQYSYYIVWGKDFTVSGDTVSASDVEYLHYFRETSSGYSSSYSYEYGSLSDFSFLKNHMVVTNLDSFGFSNELYLEFEFFKDLMYLAIFLLAFIFVIMISNLRKGYKYG